MDPAVKHAINPSNIFLILVLMLLGGRFAKPGTFDSPVIEIDVSESTLPVPEAPVAPGQAHPETEIVNGIEKHMGDEPEQPAGMITVETQIEPPPGTLPADKA